MESFRVEILGLMKRGSEDMVKVAAFACTANGFEDVASLDGAPAIGEWKMDDEKLKDIGFQEYNPAMKAYIASLIKAASAGEANPEKQGHREKMNEAGRSESLECLLEMAEKTKKKKRVAVAVGPQLQSASLKDLVQTAWPAVDPTSDIATEMNRQAEEGVKRPCPYVPMEKFTPCWAVEYNSAREGDNKKRQEDIVDHRVWPAAAHRWAVAMHCAGAVKYETAIAHIDTCMRAGHEAFTKGTAGNYGKRVEQTYDQLKRKLTEERIKAGEPDYNVDRDWSTLDETS